VEVLICKVGLFLSLWWFVVILFLDRLCLFQCFDGVVRFSALEEVIVSAPTLWRRICYVELWKTSRNSSNGAWKYLGSCFDCQVNSGVFRHLIWDLNPKWPPRVGWEDSSFWSWVSHIMGWEGAHAPPCSVVYALPFFKNGADSTIL
jgi:hypothetical protein